MIDRGSSTRSLRYGVALAFLAASMAPAYAQTGGAQSTPQASGGGLEEIVVTARKREERLQDVPLVVDAFTAQDISRRGLQSLADVALSTPGLQFESFNSGLASPVIRGAAQQNINNLEQNVSTFFDGIYLPRTYVTDLGLLDLARVEVIKGPQSSRYGRNAFMGAINYVPERPGQALDANVSLTYGSDDRGEASAAIGGPLVPGMLAGRVSYAWRTFDGTVPNSAPFTRGPRPGTRGNLGGTERKQWAGQLRLTPVESLTVDAGYWRFEIKDEPTPTYLFGNAGGAQPFVRTNCGRTAAGERVLYCGQMPTRDSVDIDVRAYGRQADVDLYRGAISWAITDQWSVNYLYGRVKAETAQVGYSDTISSTCPYFDPRPTCLFQNVPIGTLDYESHEVRVGWALDKRFRATLGYYRNDGDDLNVFPFGFVPVLTAPPTAPLPASGGAFGTLSNVTTTTKDRSWFAELGVGLLDGRLRLSGEMRRGDEDKVQLNNVSGLRLAGTFRSSTPRVTAEFDVAPQHLVYASAAKGIRTGGFNANAFLPENRTYRPEENWTYELGSKNELLDSRVILNAALFYVKAKDTQISSRDPSNPSPTAIQILLNLGSFTSKGAEVQASWRVAEPLTLRLGAAYTDATYDGGTVDVRFIPLCDNVTCPSSGAIGGKRLQRQSPLSANAGIDWQQPLRIGTHLQWFVRGDVAYQGKQYVDQMNLSWIGARTVTYASAGVQSDRWEARLWGRNLFDRSYIGQSFFTPGAATSYTPILGERRNYGATVSLRF